MIRIMNALTTAELFERGSIVLDVSLMPPLQFVAAEAGTDAMERSCVRQLTQTVTRLQKVDYDRATISLKSHLADTAASSQLIAENPNVRAISVLTGGGHWRSSSFRLCDLILTVSTSERDRLEYVCGLNGAAEVFANLVKKRSMDGSHAISVAVTQARAVAASAQSVSLSHFCLRCVVPGNVVRRVGASLSDSRPGSKNRPKVTRWPLQSCSCAKYIWHIRKKWTPSFCGRHMPGNMLSANVWHQQPLA